MSPRLKQVNIRLPDLTIRQIALLRKALDLRSDAAVVTMAIDRMAQAELPDWRSGPRRDG